MVKKDKEYLKLDLKQSKLKSTLHENIRQYIKYRVKRKGKDTAKTVISMAGLQGQQKEINLIRQQIEKTPIQLIRSLRKTLKHL